MLLDFIEATPAIIWITLIYLAGLLSYWLFRRCQIHEQRMSLLAITDRRTSEIDEANSTIERLRSALTARDAAINETKENARRSAEAASKEIAGLKAQLHDQTAQEDEIRTLKHQAWTLDARARELRDEAAEADRRRAAAEKLRAEAEELKAAADQSSLEADRLRMEAAAETETLRAVMPEVDALRIALANAEQATVTERERAAAETERAALLSVQAADDSALRAAEEERDALKYQNWLLSNRLKKASITAAAKPSETDETELTAPEAENQATPLRFAAAEEIDGPGLRYRNWLLASELEAVSKAARQSIKIDRDAIASTLSEAKAPTPNTEEAFDTLRRARPSAPENVEGPKTASNDELDRLARENSGLRYRNWLLGGAVGEASGVLKATDASLADALTQTLSNAGVVETPPSDGEAASAGLGFTTIRVLKPLANGVATAADDAAAETLRKRVSQLEDQIKALRTAPPMEASKTETPTVDKTAILAERADLRSRLWTSEWKRRRLAAAREPLQAVASQTDHAAVDEAGALRRRAAMSEAALRALRAEMSALSTPNSTKSAPTLPTAPDARMIAVSDDANGLRRRAAQAETALRTLRADLAAASVAPVIEPITAAPLSSVDADIATADAKNLKKSRADAAKLRQRLWRAEWRLRQEKEAAEQKRDIEARALQEAETMQKRIDDLEQQLVDFEIQEASDAEEAADLRARLDQTAAALTEAQTLIAERNRALAAAENAAALAREEAAQAAAAQPKREAEAQVMRDRIAALERQVADLHTQRSTDATDAAAAVAALRARLDQTETALREAEKRVAERDGALSQAKEETARAQAETTEALERAAAAAIAQTAAAQSFAQTPSEPHTRTTLTSETSAATEQASWSTSSARQSPTASIDLASSETTPSFTDAAWDDDIDISVEASDTPIEGVLKEAVNTPLSGSEAAALELIEAGDIVADNHNRPSSLLDAPTDGAPDDLKLIRGVGPKLEGLLNGLGVYHFDQIASFSPVEIAWIDTKLGFRGRIVRDRWRPQAAYWAQRKNTGALAIGDEGAWTIWSGDPNNPPSAPPQALDGAEEVARQETIETVSPSVEPIDVAAPLSGAELAALELIEAGDFIAHDTARPTPLLDAPSRGAPDDLKLIRGVGPKLEGLLNGLGLYYFAQFLELDPQGVAWIDAKLAFKGRIVRDRWAPQAQRWYDRKRAGALYIGHEGAWTARDLGAAPARVSAISSPPSLQSPPSPRADAEAVDRARRTLQQETPPQEAAPQKDHSAVSIAPSSEQADSIERIALEIMKSADHGGSLARRPSELTTAPPAGGVDDLQLINGIGPQVEAQLNDLGVFLFEQIANLSSEELVWLDQALRLETRAARDRWVSQARDWLRRKSAGELRPGSDGRWTVRTSGVG